MKFRSNFAGVTIVLIAQIVVGQEGPAPASASPDSVSRYVLALERITVVGREIRDTVDLSIDFNGDSIAGFDLTIAVDHPSIAITEVIRGELPDSCGWEYFTARPLDSRTNASLPASTWQIVGLARFVAVDSGPTCYSLAGKPTLARLVLAGPAIGVLQDTTVALFFLWGDCTDNVLSGPSGAGLSISRNVVDYTPVSFQSRQPFPTRLGAHRSCINPKARIQPKRQVDFHNGSITFRAIGVTTLPSASDTSSIRDDSGPQIPDSARR